MNKLRYFNLISKIQYLFEYLITTLFYLTVMSYVMFMLNEGHKGVKQELGLTCIRTEKVKPELNIALIFYCRTLNVAPTGCGQLNYLARELPCMPLVVLYVKQ